MKNEIGPRFVQRKREFAQRLRRARSQKGWTQQQVADLLGCSRRRYNLVERGMAELGMTEIDLLASELKMPVMFFFENEGDQAVTTSGEAGRKEG